MTEKKNIDSKLVIQKRLDLKESIIGVIGLGYVGLPLSLTFAEAGYRVVGLDIDKNKSEALNSGFSYLSSIKDTRIKQQIDSKKFRATNDFFESNKCDALIICVPTPLNNHKEPDLSFVKATMNSLLPYLRKEQVISLESTTYPGTTEEVLKPLILSTNLTVGDDIFLVYSPERENPGNEDYTTYTIPKVIAGSTSRCKDVGISLYEKIIKTLVPVSTTQTAEMTKLLENIYRSVNIGLINEIKIISDSMKIDIHEVIRAASTKPFGFVPYYPGPGWGGHCIPVDPFYLTWKAKEFGMHSRFIELAGEINQEMPNYVVSKCSDVLNKYHKSINGTKILVLGISYKKNIDDCRESPAVEIISILKDKGAVVSYSDPFFKSFPKMKKYNYELSSCEINPSILRNFDLVLLATDHDAFDYELILENSNLIIDTRGKFLKSDKVWRA